MDKVRSTILDSDLFDSKWYMSEYPDVAILGMDPLEHYLHLGAGLFRDPGPNFSTKAYLEEYPDVAKAGINPLYHYLVWGEQEGRARRKTGSKSRLRDSPVSLCADSSALSEETPYVQLPDWHLPRASLVAGSLVLKPFSVMDLEVKLWGGYSTYAIPALEQLKCSSSTSDLEKIDAGWHLARWYFVEEKYEESLRNVLFSKYYCLRRLQKNVNALMKLTVVESQCLAKLGKYDRARRALDKIRVRLPGNPNLNLAWASVAGRVSTIDDESANERDAPLPWINKLFVDKGLATLKKKNASEPLSFYNFTSEYVNPLPKAATREKVSVVIPAYCAEEMIHIPVLSLLNQTWSNIEVIVVDDCSPDNTAGVVEKIARSDPRVKLIRKDSNEGAYPARNLGLKYATGDFIMVHDSDDWSHPQKIEIQMAGFKAAENPVAVVSHWVRFDERLRPVGAWRPTGSYFDLNFSSLMFRRQIIDELGGWDEVRVSGDAEYRARIARRYGKDSIVKISPGYLLSLSLMREDSLTQTKITHLRSLDFGLRWLYRDAYQFWHGSKQFEERPSVGADEARPFPVPKILRSRATTEATYDFLLVCDLSVSAWVSELLAYIEGACKRKWTISLCHWPRYLGYVHSPIDPRIYSACQKHNIEIITNGDNVTVKSAFVPYPEVFEYKLDQFPRVQAHRLTVVASEAFARGASTCGLPKSLPEINKHIADFFGRSGVWWAESLDVLQTFKQSKHAIELADDLWFPLLAPTKRIVRTERTGGVSRPRIGRVVPHPIVVGASWPKSFRVAKRAYCADSLMKCYLLCDQDLVCSHFGRRPKNWHFEMPGATEVEQFLQKIDFYLYFPDEGYGGACEHAAFKAMAMGIPVVTYPNFRKIFGNAAIYAWPQDVESVVTTYWEERTLYEEAGVAAARFASLHCGDSSLERRF